VILGYCYQQSQLQLPSDTVISYFQPLSPQPTLLNTIFALASKPRPAAFYHEIPGLIQGRTRGFVASKLVLELPHLRVLRVSLINGNSKCSIFIQLWLCRRTQQAAAPKGCPTPTHNRTRHSTSFSTVNVGTSFGAMTWAYASTDSVLASTPWE
jgi:hypothetical protein